MFPSVIGSSTRSDHPSWIAGKIGVGYQTVLKRAIHEGLKEAGR